VSANSIRRWENEPSVEREKSGPATLLERLGSKLGLENVKWREGIYGQFNGDSIEGSISGKQQLEYPQFSTREQILSETLFLRSIFVHPLDDDDAQLNSR